LVACIAATTRSHNQRRQAADERHAADHAANTNTKAHCTHSFLRQQASIGHSQHRRAVSVFASGTHVTFVTSKIRADYIVHAGGCEMRNAKIAV
jgi:hypothetical protein